MPTVNVASSAHLRLRLVAWLEATRSAGIWIRRQIVLLLFGLLTVFSTVAADDMTLGKELSRTAKLVFARDGAGSVQALVIPYKEDGSYPRSGWIQCRIEDQLIVADAARKLASLDRVEGYFHARYRILDKDRSTPVLRYHGVLLGVDPWSPAFLADPR